MKRSTAALLTGALAASGTIALATLVPSIASADSCGPTTVTQLDKNGWTFPYNPNNPSGTTTDSDARIDKDLDDLLLEIAPGGRSIARYNIGTGDAAVPLAEQTAYSEYALTGPGVSDTGFSYQLVLDLNRPAAETAAGLTDFTQLVNERAALTPDDEWYSTRALPAAGMGANVQTDTATLDEISVAYPNARIEAFLIQLGKFGDASVAADSQVSSVTFGCNVFEFNYANSAPAATFTAEGTDLRVDVDGSGSTDPDGDDLTYSFDFGDGTPPATTAVASHTYASAGTYTITLTVTDEEGETATVSKDITVARATNTTQDNELAGTGADVKGLAALGALVVVGSGAGLMANRRRRTGAHAA